MTYIVQKKSISSPALQLLSVVAPVSVLNNTDLGIQGQLILHCDNAVVTLSASDADVCENLLERDNYEEELTTNSPRLK
jgi:hypothetical protein